MITRASKIVLGLGRLEKLTLKIPVVIVLLFVFLSWVRADGTRNFIEPADSIGNGLSWQNEACFYLFNATEANPYIGTVEAEEDERFYIHIEDPANEVIYLGFNVSQSNYNNTDLHFRVKAPDGSTVQDYTAVPTTGNGYVSSYKSIYEGPSPTVTSGGYVPIVVDPDPNQSGDYYIEFNNVGYGETLGYTPSATSYIVTFQFFDVSVGESSATPSGSKTHDLVEGRFFAYQFPMTNYHDQSQLNYDGVDVDYYVYHHTDKVTTKLHWEKVVGGGWIIMFNQHGPTDTGNLANDRKSNTSTSSSLSSPSYRIFFAPPDEAVYEPTDVEPIFAFEDYRFDCETNQRAFFFTINRSGRLEMLMEFNDGYDNGYYDPNTSDRILIVEDVTVNRNKVLWDGLDGLGVSRTSATFTINMNFSIGSLNNPMFDVEQVMGGIQAELISPDPITFGWDQYPKVHYDDEDISNLGNYDYDGSTSLTHIFPYQSWQRGNSNYNYGNQVWINSWWTAHEETISQTINVDAAPGTIPIDTIWLSDPTSCSSDDGEMYIEGLIGGDDYEVTYDFNSSTQGPTTYTADGNGVITISSLSPGDYDNIKVASGSCDSTSAEVFSMSCVTADDNEIACQANPGGTYSIDVPSSGFSGAPYVSNTLTHLRFETFPENVTSITIDGVTYNNQSDLGSGVEVAAGFDGSSTVDISVDPIDNVSSVTVYYLLKDDKGAYSGEANLVLLLANMSLSADVTTTDCSGGTSGELDLTVVGGQMPYSYLWSNGATSEDVTGLSVGYYTVEVTDDNGCTAKDSFEVTATPIAGTCNIQEGSTPGGNANELIALNAADISGVGWSDLNDMVTDDEVYATELIIRSSSANMISAGSLDFSAIPSDATIDGITVSINRYASGNGIRDNVLQLEINGSTSTNYGDDGTNWYKDGGEETKVYGGATDLWGFAEITRTNLNSLELQYLLRNNNGSNDRTAYIDYISIRVDYTSSSSYIDNQSYTFYINPADYPEATGFSWSINRSALLESVSVDETSATFDLNNRGVGDYEICVLPYNDCATGSPCCTTIAVVDDGGGMSVAGTVFADVDLDGILEFGEPGVDSVLVKLYQDKDASATVSVGDVLVNSQYTDSLGNYLFTVFETTVENDVKDYFDTDNEYSSNDGTQSWSGDWQLDNATYTYISGGQFVFHYIWDEDAYRELDLSGATSATLTFGWSSSGLDSGEELDVEISSDGGSNYTSLATFGFSPTSGIFSQDISAYIASNTRVRFVNNTSNWESGEYVYIDSIQIVYTSTGYSDYAIEVDLTTIPDNSVLTTDNIELASPTDVSPFDGDNDFGLEYADIELFKTDYLTEVHLGDSASYQLKVTNNGPTNATNVVVTDLWPVDFTQLNVSSPTSGSIGGVVPNVTWSFGAMSLGQSDSVTLEYTVPLVATLGDHVNEISVVSDHDYLALNDTARDTTMVLDPSVFDFGDAPASYDVGIAANHLIPVSPQIYLGNIVPDYEASEQSNDGTDDDNTGIDDEDAFSFFPPYTTMRSSYTLHVPITNTSGDSVTVAAWIDMDANGIFDVSERAYKTLAMGVDTAILVWNSLPVLTQDVSTYIRIRIASDKNEISDATGAASDGELEDYPFEIYYAGDCPTEAFLIQNADGDWYDVDLATASYVLANDNHTGTINGVGYNLIDGLIYGYENSNKNGSIAITSVNSSTAPSTYKTYIVGPISGLPTGTGYYVGDVGDGKLFLRTGGADVMYVVDVDPDSPGYLSEAVEFTITGDGGATYTDWVYLPSDDMLYAINNKNGSLHRIEPDFNTNSATTTIIHLDCVPAATYGAQYLDVNGFMYCSDNTSGDIYRVSLNGNPDYNGVLWAVGPSSGQNDGSRCPLAAVPIDFGDAPASYITEVSLGTQIGARHAVPLYNELMHTAPLMLGDHIDIEIDGLPSSNADGDDTDGFDDEDGIASFATLSNTSTSYAVTVSVLNNTGGEVYVSGYIDFDGDSLFNADERADATISTSQATNQNVVLSWTGLGNTVDINSGTSYLRLRLSSQEAEVKVANGIAADGEVEDHMLIISSINTDSVTSIGDTTASLYGYISAGSQIEEYGFYYSTDNTASNLVSGGVGTIEVQSYSDAAIDIDSLKITYDVLRFTNRSAYYFRAYMRDASDNYYYGDVVRFISEKRDFSLTLDGSGDCLVIDEFYSDSVINDWGVADNTFSLEFWMKKGSALSTRQVLCEDYAATAGYVVAIDNGYIALEDHSGTTVTSDLQITDEEWHHVAVTYDNSDVYFFIDDSISALKSLALTRPQAASNCFIGAGYNGTSLESEFNGYIDALRFWNVALEQEQVSELLYDLVKEGASNTVVGVGSGKTISSLNWSSLTASLGFNVMSIVESAGDFPGSFDYNNQSEMHAYPFFHSDARLGTDSISFNIIAVGNARPSPSLPRVYWRYDNANVVWQDGDNWSGYAYPGQGATVAQYPDVATSNMENDSAYCKYTIVSISNAMATVTTTPPEVQVLVDRDENDETYYVDESNSELTILQKVVPVIFGDRVDNVEGAILIEEGAVEVYP